jgi:hypothetical protein
MKQYLVVYFSKVGDIQGIEQSFITLPYELNLKTIRHAELKLRRLFDVKKIIILAFKEINCKEN